MFRSFSYILFKTETNHLDIRKLLVEFIGLNCSLFRSYCHPLSVKDHIDKMKNNYVWGTHAEVFALALYFSIPVFVAMERSNHEYYWAKYGMSQTPSVIFPTDFHATLPNDLGHVEICHVNRNHYDVVINAVDSSLPKTVPYNGTASSSAVNSIIID